MIVSIQSEKCSLIPKQFSTICIRAKRIVSGHVFNRSAGHSIGIPSGVPVGTVGIIIRISNLVDAGIFKQIRGFNGHRCSGKADHIISQLDNARSTWHGILSIWNTAAETEIARSVIIHHYCRIKQPSNIAAIWCCTGNHSFSEWVCPRTSWAVCGQNTHPISAITEIEEKFFFAVDGFMGCTRCPRTGCPFGDAISSSNRNCSMVCPVHQILRR